MIKFLQSGNKAAKYLLAGFLLLIAASMVTYLIPGFMGDTTAATETGVVASVGGHEIKRERWPEWCRRKRAGTRSRIFICLSCGSRRSGS